MQQNSNFSRREFLKSTTAGAAAISTGIWTGFAPAATKSANGKLNIACIGTANRAAADIDGVKGKMLSHSSMSTVIISIVPEPISQGLVVMLITARCWKAKMEKLMRS